MKDKNRIRWITRTGVLLALVLAAQFIGKLVPGGMALIGPLSLAQLITGSLVNLLLILSVGVVGISSGVVIAVLSALLATLLGIGPPFPQIAPVIAVGSVLLVLAAGATFRMESNLLKGNVVLLAGGFLLGAAIKCAFLWLVVPLALSLIPELKGPQQAALSLMFSWPQFVTAVIGGILALVVLPPLRRALRTDNYIFAK